MKDLLHEQLFEGYSPNDPATIEMFAATRSRHYVKEKETTRSDLSRSWEYLPLSTKRRDTDMTFLASSKNDREINAQ
jgi:hypothetical protein